MVPRFVFVAITATARGIIQIIAPDPIVAQSVDVPEPDLCRLELVLVKLIERSRVPGSSLILVPL